MGKENFSKIKLLKIWEILKKDRDENNPLTTNQISYCTKTERSMIKTFEAN